MALSVGGQVLSCVLPHTPRRCPWPLAPAGGRGALPFRAERLPLAQLISARQPLARTWSRGHVATPPRRRGSSTAFIVGGHVSRWVLLCYSGGRTPGGVWGHLWWSHWGAPGIEWVGTRDAAPHPIVPGTAPRERPACRQQCWGDRAIAGEETGSRGQQGCPSRGPARIAPRPCAGLPASRTSRPYVLARPAASSLPVAQMRSSAWPGPPPPECRTPCLPAPRTPASLCRRDRPATQLSKQPRAALSPTLALEILSGFLILILTCLPL